MITKENMYCQSCGSLILKGQKYFNVPFEERARGTGKGQERHFKIYSLKYCQSCKEKISK